MFVSDISLSTHNECVYMELESVILRYPGIL